MAYSAVITRTADWVAKVGAITYIYEIVETDAAPASEYVLENVPVVGTITLLTVTQISGSGSEIFPAAGLVTGWSASSQNEVFATDSSLSVIHINDQTAVRYSAKDGKLYVQSGIDSGTNVIHTRITIRAGHGG